MGAASTTAAREVTASDGSQPGRHGNRFVIGHYRRQMKAIRYLGTLDRLFGVPATTRSWNAMAAIVKVVKTTAIN